MRFKTRSFYETKGVIGLSQRIKKIEAVFCISSGPDNYRVKYATGTLMDFALNWWNNHDKSMGISDAYALGGEPLNQMMIKDYFPQQEVQTLDHEL